MFLSLKARFILWSFVALEIAATKPECDEMLSDKNDVSIVLSQLASTKRLLENVKAFVIQQNLIDMPCYKPMDCAEIYENCKNTKSGIYDIWLRNKLFKCPIKVYCDMDDDGGGWTVIQRRGDFDSGKDYFFRDWTEYKNGFGDLLKDFWIGNDVIYALTNQKEHNVKFVLADWEGNTTYATYDDFWIDNENYKYTMHVNGYRGTAGDSFKFANGASFSTKDADNDAHEPTHCAVAYKGAWWYVKCHSSNLNGYYLRGSHESNADGVEWSTFRGQKYSLKDTFIKIRPTGFKNQIENNVTPL